MANAGNYLLERIAQHNKHGLDSLGDFNAKHFNDIVKVMVGFADSVITEFAEAINKGESVNVNGKTYSLKKIKPKKKP